MKGSISRKDGINGILKDFFYKNQSKLNTLYPGITLQTLKRAIEDYLPMASFQSASLFGDYFVNYKFHPLKVFLQKLDKGIPLAYITGKAHFYGLELVVNSSVLIPRNETEILVEFCIEECDRRFEGVDKLNFCEVGIGSGCISLAIMANCEKSLQGIGVDVSAKALAVAKENYFLQNFRLDFQSNLEFLDGDRLEGLEDNSFDFIVSNPPYIMKMADRKMVHSQVLNHEPEVALFLDDESYYEWFRKFFLQINEKLKAGGFTVIESSEVHIHEQLELLRNSNLKECRILKDLLGKPRFLFAEK